MRQTRWNHRERIDVKWRRRVSKIDERKNGKNPPKAKEVLGKSFIVRSMVGTRHNVPSTWFQLILFQLSCWSLVIHNGFLAWPFVPFLTPFRTLFCLLTASTLNPLILSSPALPLGIVQESRFFLLDMEFFFSVRILRLVNVWWMLAKDWWK